MASTGAKMNPLDPPFGLHTVTPYLVVENVRELISFLSKVFGAVLRGEPRTRDDGSVQHAEVTIGNSVIMMADSTKEFPPIPEIRIFDEEAIEYCAYVFIDGRYELYDLAIHDHEFQDKTLLPK